MNVKTEMDQLDESDKPDEIMKCKVKLYDLVEERVKCDRQARKLADKVTEFKQQAAELVNDVHMKEEKTSSLFNSDVVIATEKFLDAGSAQRDKSDTYIPHSESRSYVCKAPRCKRGDDLYTFLLRYEEWVVLSGTRQHLDLKLTNQI